MSPTPEISGPEIRVMTLTDVEPLAAAMARAFYDDPLQVWAIPDEHIRRPLLTKVFAVLFEHMDLPYGLSYCDASQSTAAIWLPPVLQKPSAEAMAALASLNDVLGTAGKRFARSQQAMDAARPTEPHYYLQGLGTDPSAQGKGLASAALAPVLARADDEQVPSYLESTKERNLPLYERHGFAVTGTIDVPDDGPRLWSMWREPRSR